jgi:hypothetical protein
LVVASACGGGKKGLTLDAYFQRIVKLDQDHEAVAEPLRKNFDTASSGLQDANLVPADLKQTLTQLFDNEEAFATKLEKIDPPAAAKATHEEAVAALKAEVDQGRSITAGISGATATMADMNAAFGSDEVGKRRTNACLALQKLAQDNDISADLTC